MIYIDSKNTVTFYDAPETIERAIHDLLMCRDDTDVGLGYDGELTRPAYEQGLNDAWELAKKIVLPTRRQHDAFTCEDLNNVFGAKCCDNVMSRYSASEAIAKIKEYEEQKKEYEEQKKAEAEIKVGDEVIVPNGKRCVVTGFNGDDNKWILCIDENGDCGPNYHEKTDLKKTGRHFPQIEEVLKQMKGD